MELLFPLLLLVPLLLLILRQRKQQRAFVDQQGRVRVGMQVMTTAGLFGTVVDIQDDVLVLEVADGVRLRWSKLAVGKILGDSAAVASSAEDGLPYDSSTSTEEPVEGRVDVRKRVNPGTSTPDGV